MVKSNKERVYVKRNGLEPPINYKEYWSHYIKLVIKPIKRRKPRLERSSPMKPLTINNRKGIL